MLVRSRGGNEGGETGDRWTLVSVVRRERNLTLVRVAGAQVSLWCAHSLPASARNAATNAIVWWREVMQSEGKRRNSKYRFFFYSKFCTYRIVLHLHCCKYCTFLNFTLLLKYIVIVFFLSCLLSFSSWRLLFNSADICDFVFALTCSQKHFI